MCGARPWGRVRLLFASCRGSAMFPTPALEHFPGPRLGVVPPPIEPFSLFVHPHPPPTHTPPTPTHPPSRQATASPRCSPKRATRACAATGRPRARSLRRPSRTGWPRCGTTAARASWRTSRWCALCCAALRCWPLCCIPLGSTGLGSTLACTRGHCSVLNLQQGSMQHKGTVGSRTQQIRSRSCFFSCPAAAVRLQQRACSPPCCSRLPAAT